MNPYDGKGKKLNFYIYFTEEFMHTISVEELENLDPSNITILDIRSEEDFRRGSFPGAINIPMKKNLDEDSAEEGFFEPGSIETLEKDLPGKQTGLYSLPHRRAEQEAVKILTRTATTLPILMAATAPGSAFPWSAWFQKLL